MVHFSQSVRSIKSALSLRADLKKFDRDLDAGDLVLVKRLMNEFHGVAILAATISSILSARSAGIPVRLQGSINSYLPGQPLIFPVFIASVGPRSIDPDMIHNLQEFYIRCQFAGNMTAHWPLEPKPALVVSNVDYNLLINTWSGVCGLALIIYYNLDGLDLKNDDLKGRLGELRETLRLARDGQHPCVAGDGTVVVPGWIDRRREPRIQMNLPIWVHAQGVRQRSIVQDASVTGLGIASCKGIQPGMPCIAELSNGRQLAGIAVWTDNENRIGVQLSQPLSTSDPLLNPWTQGG